MGNRLKILLLLIISIFCLSSTYSVEYLNSCGKNSGWIDGETYYINFTEVPTSYPNNYCFSFNAGTHNDIIFKQVTDLITINKQVTGAWTSNRFSFFDVQQNSLNTGFEIRNINIDVPYFVTRTQTGPRQFVFIDGQNVIPSSNQFDNATLDNITIIGITNFINGYDSNTGFDFRYNTLNDLFLYGQGLYTATAQDSYIYNEFTNSVLVLDYVTKNTFLPQEKLRYTTFENVVVISPKYTTPFLNSLLDVNFTSSLIEGRINFDTNGNNIADSEIDSKTYLSVISTELRGYKFIQDFEFGNTFIGSNDKVVPINPELLNNEDSVIYPLVDLSLNLNSYKLLDENSIQLQKDNNLFNFFPFYTQIELISDDVTTQNSTNQFKGMMTIFDDNILISELNFSKNRDNNLHILSNTLNIAIENINIKDNYFSKADENFKNDNNYFIKLRANSLTIENNVFRAVTTINGGYEYLDITEDFNENNRVTHNEFLFDTSFSTTSEVFTNSNTETKFYNNYLDSKVVLTETATEFLNVTPQVAYLHTDGMVYFYTIGNYYVDNTGCIDSNGDLFCDSPYTSGNITDTKPLSTYPFDYAGQLLNADFVSSGNFTVTLINTTGGIKSIATGTTPLYFSMQQNSNIPYLNCDFMLNDTLFARVVNPNANQTYTFSENTWSETDYTFYVKCYRDDIIQYSETINFSISFSGAVISGCTDSSATNYNPSATVDDGSCTYTNGGGGIDLGGGGLTDLFDSNPETAVNNISSLFSLMNEPLTWLIIIGVVVLIFSMLGLMFGLVGYLIK